MSAFLIALVALAMASALQRLWLMRRARQLVAFEQAFRFHSIRDELQLLAVRGEAPPDSELYQFLMWTANLAIRNAGTMKLRDIVAVARAVDKRMHGEPKRYRQLEDVIKSSPRPLQRIAGETFESLTNMLIANDPIVRAGLHLASFALTTWRRCRPAFISLARQLEHVAPWHAEAVQYARKYENYERIANQLSAA